MRPKWMRNKKTTSVLEQKVVDETKKAAKKCGFLHRKIKYANRNGAPDDWFFGFDGELVIIEFKAPGKVPEPHQIEEIKRLKNRGFEVHVIDTVEGGQALFEGRGQW